jgi:hypothetical protein
MGAGGGTGVLEQFRGTMCGTMWTSGMVAAGNDRRVNADVNVWLSWMVVVLPSPM